MIVVRHYGEADLARVKELHAKQGLEYALPNLDADTMLVRTVIENGNGVTNAAFLRKTAEAYWLFDPAEGRKRDRAGILLVLHKELNAMAKRAGFEDCHIWVPPDLAKRFEGTLFHLGWKKPEWTCYHREVK